MKLLNNYFLFFLYFNWFIYNNTNMHFKNSFSYNLRKLLYISLIYPFALFLELQQRFYV